jgi:biotin-(acetyl-CoA carboxylase) ligase
MFQNSFPKDLQKKVIGIGCNRKERRINSMEYEQYWQEQRKCRVQREVDEKMHLLSVNERASNLYHTFHTKI